MTAHGGLEFRRARFSELAHVATFWLAMFEDIGMHREADFRSDWRDAFVEYFERRIAGGEAAYIVAAQGEKLVGCAAAILADGYPSAIHGLRLGYVLGVYVLPDFRGGGIATKLTELAIAFLRGCGVTSIRLHASPFGRNIYERLGFTDVGTEMRLSIDQ